MSPIESSDEKDIFRHTPVRFLGYANEVGEAFRSLVKPVVVKFSYVVAFGYVAADSIDKGFIESQKTHVNTTEKTKKVAIATVDTVLWQTFASVLIPGFTINRFCFSTNMLLQKSTKLPTTVRKWTVTTLGLATIPFIVHPIDTFVEETMNKTARKVYNE
ncbi:CRE-MTP-18 protein [Caenorhabditis remanei]|uniref:Mitochondrial fission process protein 1 n=1 Tax=Caenorhabditis remanei TaxID=31234 RepID=E3LDN2_CAERE|nr:CRE-MTP-18 protein [Caenorhabditis remanei]